MHSIANNPHFTILDETEDYIVVDKPAPLQIHPKKPGGPVTLYDGLRELLAYEIANGGQVSIINRLDRETSVADGDGVADEQDARQPRDIFDLSKGRIWRTLGGLGLGL